MLFDEATSHLDVITEQIINRNTSVLACTRIVIAHRLETQFETPISFLCWSRAKLLSAAHIRNCLGHGYYARLIRQQQERDGEDWQAEDISPGTVQVIK